MNDALLPFFWVAITLPIIYFFHRWIHRHLHGVALLLTGNKSWAIILYAIVLFPGVLLHELSHWLTATLLGVRTGKFSVLPKTNADGYIQLGYVEYYKSKQVGPIRESLIGAAPLITGTIVILLIAFKIFDVTILAGAVQSGNIEQLTDALTQLFGTTDFLLWLYLLFTIANAMMPSGSDRRAWPAFALFMILLAVVLYILGLANVLVERLVGPVSTTFGYLGLAYSLVIGVDLVFMLIIYLVEWILSRLKGVDVVYDRPIQ